MDKKCGIARDLMPLVIDNAASEGSAELVFKHIEGCSECSAQFEEMKKKIDPPVSSETDASFAHSVWLLKRKQKRKRILLSILCLFLTVCLAFTGLEVYNGLLIHNSVVKSADKLEFLLFALPSGELQILAKCKDSEDAIFLLTGDSSYNENGKNKMYVFAYGPRFDFLQTERQEETADLFGYQSLSKLYFIDGQLYWLHLSYDVKTIEAEDGSRGLEYIVRWEAPEAVDEICYGLPGEQTDNPVLYRAGDDIPELSADDYIACLEETFGGEQDLPHDFYGNNTYVFSLAKAWIRGEELPEIPREYLPSIMDFPDMEGGTEKATLYVYYTSGSERSTLYEPLVISQHTYKYSLPMEPAQQESGIPESNR